MTSFLCNVSGIKEKQGKTCKNWAAEWQQSIPAGFILSKGPYSGMGTDWSCVSKCGGGTGASVCPWHLKMLAALQDGNGSQQVPPSSASLNLLFKKLCSPCHTPTCAACFSWLSLKGDVCAFSPLLFALCSICPGWCLGTLHTVVSIITVSHQWVACHGDLSPTTVESHYISGGCGALSVAAGGSSRHHHLMSRAMTPAWLKQPLAELLHSSKCRVTLLRIILSKWPYQKQPQLPCRILPFFQQKPLCRP